MAGDAGESQERKSSLQLCLQRVAVADPWIRTEIPETDPNSWRNSVDRKFQTSVERGIIQ